MCTNLKSCTVFLKNLKNDAIENCLEGWSGTVQEEMLAGVAWAADSRQILTFTDLQLRATVWSIQDMTEVCYIESPKLLPPKGIDFSTNGKFMALIQKKGDCKNAITVFYAGHDWNIVNGFEINDVHDPRDCKWVMGNMGIMV